mmetsp:Transcript_27149/g.49287  ORF Transcript_27149/g.49287 Transcript_27149/m.49287 type:complete len:229 (-) Transcript_27149:157-843(-)
MPSSFSSRPTAESMDFVDMSSCGTSSAFLSRPSVKIVVSVDVSSEGTPFAPPPILVESVAIRESSSNEILSAFSLKSSVDLFDFAVNSSGDVSSAFSSGTSGGSAALIGSTSGGTTSFLSPRPSVVSAAFPDTSSGGTPSPSSLLSFWLSPASADVIDASSPLPPRTVSEVEALRSSSLFSVSGSALVGVSSFLSLPLIHDQNGAVGTCTTVGRDVVNLELLILLLFC